MRKLAILLLATAAASIVVASGDAATPAQFSDPGGDGGTAADITSVTVSSDTTGNISFVVSFAAPLAATDSVTILLDTDKNPATGSKDADGAEYAFVDDEQDQTFDLYRWNGSDWDEAPAPSAQVSGGGGSSTLLFSVNASDLGGASTFNFWVDSLDGDGGSGHEDQAPDNSTWTFGASTKLTLSVTDFMLLGPARAGKGLSAALIVSRSDTGDFLGDEGTVQCKATVGGRRLNAIVVEVSVTLGGTKIPVQTCTWTVPKNAKGKLLTGSVSVTFEGVTVTRPFKSKVR